MKRAITMSVGALVLSLFLASTALANSKCFSTGPLENAAETETATASTAFTVKILNNDNEDDVDANIVAFRFLDSNGEEPRRKMFIEATSVEIPPLSSIARVILLGARSSVRDPGECGERGFRQQQQ